MDETQTAAAELESGYSDTPTATPAPVVKAEEKPAPEEVKAEAAPDPIKELTARFEKFEATTSKLAGHIGGLTRTQQEIQQALAASKAATKTVENAPSQAQVQSALANPKEWETLKTEHPEFSSAMEKLLDHKLATQKAPLANEDIEKTVDSRLQAQLAAQAKARADEISEIHPGWQQDLWALDADGKGVRTADYEAWTKTMTPEDVSRFENSNSVVYVDRKLDQFYAWSKAQAAEKAAAAAAQAKEKEPARTNVSTRQKRLEAAVTPRGTGGHATGGSTDIDEMEAGYSS